MSKIEQRLNGVKEDAKVNINVAVTKDVKAKLEKLVEQDRKNNIPSSLSGWVADAIDDALAVVAKYQAKAPATAPKPVGNTNSIKK